MNERIRELAEQAGLEPCIIFKNYAVSEKSITIEQEKFAELIVRECKENFAKVWYEQGLDIRGAELGKFLTRFEQHFGVKE